MHYFEVFRHVRSLIILRIMAECFCIMVMQRKVQIPERHLFCVTQKILSGRNVDLNYMSH